MRPKLPYRTAAVLMAVFTVLHTLAFSQIDPKWGIDALIQQMKGTSFDVMGQQRTYWDFYFGAGLEVSAFQILVALVAWELGGLPGERLAAMPVTRWGLALIMAVVTGLLWRYFFLPPQMFSTLITLCLVAGAWSARRQA